jgi:V8-like Glu-specific endopeptidase
LLYNEKNTHELLTQTFGPYYSSSRLIPTTANASYPYSTVGKLFFTIPEQGDFFCSAAVINYRVVLTAGHCVHDGSNSKNGFFTNFSFVPAYREGVGPFLSWRGNYVAVTKAWFQSNGVLPNGADYAMIEVKDRGSVTPRRLGSDTGFLGYQINSLRFNHATILGYPKNIDHGEQMHQVTSKHAGAVLHHVVLYGSDMREGSDGGPFVQNFGTASIGQAGGLNPGRNQVIGVSSHFYNPSVKLEVSSILDYRFVNLFNKLCGHRVGNCA